MQWSSKAGSHCFQVPLRVWKKSTYFLRAVSRYSHLDPGHSSFELLITGWHSARCSPASLWWLLEELQILSTWCVRLCSPHMKSGRYFHVPRWLVSSAQCLAQQWLHVPVQSPEVWTKFPMFSKCWVYSDPAVDSRSALQGVLSLVSECTV